MFAVADRRAKMNIRRTTTSIRTGGNFWRVGNINGNGRTSDEKERASLRHTWLAYESQDGNGSVGVRCAMGANSKKGRIGFGREAKSPDKDKTGQVAGMICIGEKEKCGVTLFRRRAVK